MGSSPSFGSAPRNSTPSSDSLALRLPGFPRLTSLLRTTRRPVLQKVRRQGLLPLRLLVGQRFQVLFHSPPGVLFTFPSRYWCRSEEHTSELQSRENLVCRLLLEKK